MFIGIHYSPKAYSMNVADLARAVEEHGFESLFVPEHTHIPVNLRTLRARGPVPRTHAETFDPLLSLAIAAAVTSRLRLGTGVCLVTQRDPIVLAREVATLDVFSGGRVIFGVGVGSVTDETANHGVAPDDRWRVMRERILAMKEIWARDEAQFHGKFVNFDPIYQWPKPAQKPCLPVWIGGGGSHVLRRVVAYGDGWMPTSWSVDHLFARMAELQKLANEKGRPPIPVAVSHPEPDSAVLESYQKAGVLRAILHVEADAAEDVLPLLEQYSKLVRQFA